MLIRAIEVRRFADPCAAALAVAARRMRCDASDLVAVPLGTGCWSVTRVRDTRAEFWVRHKATGKYLTTYGLVASLELNSGRIAGYKTVGAAKTALHTLATSMGITWDDIEQVTL